MKKSVQKRAQEKRKETLKDKEEKSKVKFVEELKTTPIIQIAAQKSGIGRSTYYKWRDDDEIFAQAADSAMRTGTAFISDMAESQILKKIQEGDNTMIIFWLKNHHHSYNEKIMHRHLHEINMKKSYKESPEEMLEAAKAGYNMGIFTGEYLASVVRLIEDKKKAKIKNIEKLKQLYGEHYKAFMDEDEHEDEE